MATPSPLKTKLYIPRARAKTVPRPRLYAQLESALERRLLLISAPPGAGKTALISEWRATKRGQEVPMAWLSLDESDNDPTRFWFYVMHGLETLRPGMCAGALGMLQAAQPEPLDAIIRTMINAMADLPFDFFLALDDLHLITTEAIHEGLAFLVDRLPPQAHLILLTRADPPLPLARMRVRDDLVELRERDLRFTPDEAAAFLGQVPGLALSATEIEALTERTEGWIAGLQLAALSLRGRADAPRFLADFLSNHRYVVDFLVEEVLHQAPAPVQEFLLTTAILDRLTVPLCNAVTGRGDSQAMLEWLEQNNLFLTTLDGDRHWYRYHHLFADVLRLRLEQLDPSMVPVLYLRASAWFEEQGSLADAVSAALSAGEHRRAAELLERADRDLALRGEQATFARLLEQIPLALAAERPGLCVAAARAMLALHDKEGAARWVERGEAAQALPAEIAARAAAVRSFLARFENDLTQAAALVGQAVAGIPEADLSWRSFTAMNQAAIYAQLGDMAGSERATQESARLALAVGDTHTAAISTCVLAELSEVQGDLARAQQRFGEALALAGPQGRAAGWARIGLGRVLYEQNDLAGAEREVTAGLAIAERTHHLDGRLRGYVALNRIRLTQGDMSEARRLADMLIPVVEAAGVVVARGLPAVIHARVAVAQGEWEEAARWAERVGESALEPNVMARLLQAQGRASEAVAALDQQVALLKDRGMDGQWVALVVAQALARLACGDEAGAVANLEDALRLGEATGRVRTFTDEGAPMALLLRRAVAAGIHRSYAQRLLAAMEAQPQPSASAGRQAPAPAPARLAAPQPLLDPLTDREMEILGFLAEGLSNQEIAERAFLAVGTVKRHVHNILGKLDAKDRVEALSRARSLSLL